MMVEFQSNPTSFNHNSDTILEIEFKFYLTLQNQFVG